MDETSHLRRYFEKEVKQVPPDDRVSGAELGQGHSCPEAAHNVLYSSSFQLLELLLHLAVPDRSHCLALVINLDVGRTVVDNLGSSHANQRRSSSSCLGPVGFANSIDGCGHQVEDLNPCHEITVGLKALGQGAGNLSDHCRMVCALLVRENGWAVLLYWSSSKAAPTKLTGLRADEVSS